MYIYIYIYIYICRCRSRKMEVFWRVPYIRNALYHCFSSYAYRQRSWGPRCKPQTDHKLHEDEKGNCALYVRSIPVKRERRIIARPSTPESSKSWRLSMHILPSRDEGKVSMCWIASCHIVLHCAALYHSTVRYSTVSYSIICYRNI